MPIKIALTRAQPLSFAADLVAVGIPEGGKRSDIVRRLGGKIGATVQKTIKRSEFNGKKGQTCEIATAGAFRPARVLLIGLGPTAKLKFADIRRFAAVAARRAAHSSCESLGVAMPEVGFEGAERAAAEGIVLGSYRYERFKTEESRAKYPLERVTLITSSKVTNDQKRAVELGSKVGASVCIARDLINDPPNELYPEALAKVAVEIAKKRRTAGLSCTVLDDKQLMQKGMRLLEAVGRGSVRKPRFIHLKYRPVGAGKKKLKRFVFVGKGLTFDTGGICIKPAPGMEEMKGDMGGAANVLALMDAVAVTQPEAEIHGLIASAENMPGGNAYRPGDVFKSYQGKTVEIINTDAEGRLALADALAYGVALEPDMMLDNATLTGAMVVALGALVSGYYTNRDELAQSFADAAEDAGEAMWHMPLVDDYREKLKSDWADIKHMGDRWGGSITAALFLREFVGDKPWIHVDIAGPSMADKHYDIYSKGGTGQGVLTYLRLIERLLS
jgi:leucyl aminopeptidase